jgi:hypothetical protein
MVQKTVITQKAEVKEKTVLTELQQLAGFSFLTPWSLFLIIFMKFCRYPDFQFVFKPDLMERNRR